MAEKKRYEKACNERDSWRYVFNSNNVGRSKNPRTVTASFNVQFTRVACGSPMRDSSGRIARPVAIRLRSHFRLE